MPPPGTRRGGKTVQDYIDEIPVWPDGTMVTSLPMTGMQKRIWGLAVAGKFFEGLVVFMTGVALPLIDASFGLHATGNSIVSAATLFGILIGATMLGGLADIFGRKPMFIVEMALFVLFLVALVVSPSFVWLAVCLFGVGMALGCDYPTAHVVIAEAVPSRGRGMLILGAFAFQAVGAICGALLGVVILSFHPGIDAWRYMFAMAIPPAILVVIGRFFVCDSAHWLVSRGRIKEAEAATLMLLQRDPPYPKVVDLINPHHDAALGGHRAPKGGMMSLFDTPANRRATFLASLPWFLQDLSTYGIGIFTPVILAATLGAAGHAQSVAGLIHKVELSAKGTALLDVLLIIGILAAIMMVERAGRIWLQIIGFVGCAIGLGLAALSENLAGGSQLTLLFAGFMLFNFMTNMGPNAQTYLLAGEVFPTHIRGYGAGFAASFAKVGAVLTAFLFPILLKSIGTQALLILLIGSSLLGAVVTWVFRIETRGRLDHLHGDHAPAASAPQPVPPAG
ncbi:MFS transporter [Acidisoma sp. C75]